MPPRRTAVEVTTGTPSSADSLSRSMSMPRRRAMSIMLSTSSIGRPTCFSSMHEAERDAQVGGVGDAEQQVGRLLRWRPPEHDVAGDLLVGAAPAQRIGAGQIDQIDAMAGRRLEHAGFALDGDARIVGDLLPAAGQRIEQRGLAAVRRADQREVPGAGFGRGRHSIPSAHEDRHRLAAAQRDRGVVDAAPRSGRGRTGPRAGSRPRRPRQSRVRAVAARAPPRSGHGRRR